MVLLENFGAEPFTVNLERSNYVEFVCLLPEKVTQPVTPGIPKLRKESHPERAKDNEDHSFIPSEPYPGGRRLTNRAAIIMITVYSYLKKESD
jgi:hypothetical protein